MELLADIDEIINAETKLAAQKNRIDTASDGCVTVISEGDPLLTTVTLAEKLIEAAGRFSACT